MSHSTQNKSFRRCSPSQCLGLVVGMEKQNLTQQKHTVTNQMKCTTTQNKELKPGLDASYDIRPGNGEGLFWFRRFINWSLTHLLRHYPLTYSPRATRGWWSHKHLQEQLWGLLEWYSLECLPITLTTVSVHWAMNDMAITLQTEQIPGLFQ